MSLLEVSWALKQWVYFVIYGFEFLVALIATIRLLRSEHKKAGVAVLLFMFSPIVLALNTFNVLGQTLAMLASHLFIAIMLIILLFSVKKQKTDEFSL